MIDVERLKHDRDYWDEVAPDGATHYNMDTSSPWINADAGAWWDQDRWKKYTIKEIFCDHAGDAIPRPTRKQWSGPEDGLPPVGTKGATSGGVCDVLAVDEVRDQIAIRWHDGELGVVAVQSFRPLKSEKERVVEYWIGRLPWPGKAESDSFVLSALYDMGALKMPEEDQ